MTLAAATNEEGGDITVVIADDQEMVRAGFRLILDSVDGIRVVGEAADGRAAIELAERLRPDVALMAIRMPLVDGLEATRVLAGPDVPDPLRVVVVTTFDLDEYVHAALRNGAAGFLLKDAGPALLIEAVRSAARGDVLVSPSVTVRLLQHFAAASSAAAGGRSGEVPAQQTAPLTDREEEVLQAAARGRSNAEIATELYISLSTVKSHLAALMDKIGARNRVELAAWAWQTGRMH
ncbi:response regulator transcription factor [soil metagenome]